jgi:uncharacterized membrane protein
MDNYPQAVATIANDYMERMKTQLGLVPVRERDEFLREIESHVFEAYHQTPGDDEIARILAVLRNLGEPGEVVADRLPGAMVRSGTTRSVPLHVLAGILIALFGIPLGFGGVAVFVGVLVTLAAMVATYYVAMGALFFTAALFVCLGLVRSYSPGLWDRLVTVGVIHIDWKLEQILSYLSAEGQGVLLIVVGAVALAAGLAMLWGGRYLIRGLRFLYSVGFDTLRRLAQTARRKLRSTRAAGFEVPRFSFVK